MSALQLPVAGFPYENSRAALLLRAGLERTQKDLGISIRALGKKLGYKQATVLSHMASGRVPVPLERALPIAHAAGINAADFLIACIEQRVGPGAADLLLSSKSNNRVSFGLASELEAIAGNSLDQLTDEQKGVMRKVAADPRPARRWLSEAELPFVESVRNLRPNFTTDGLRADDRMKIDRALSE